MKKSLVLIALLAACVSHAENRAVLVAVSAYDLPAPKLEGPAFDVVQMEASLKRRGFQTLVLKDAAATRKAIKKALDDSKSLTSADKFVFYFAGHGSTEPNPCILPFDYGSGNANAISGKQLDAWVSAIPCQSKTIILDSCFSGAMMDATKSLSDGVTLRCFNPIEEAEGAEKAAHPQPKGEVTGLVAPEHSGKVCDVVATASDQPAGEVPINGVKGRRGLFTFALNKVMAELPPDTPWGDILKAAHQEMMKLAPPGFSQNPVVNASFVKTAPFQPAGSLERPLENPATIPDVFTTKLADPAAFSLTTSVEGSRMCFGQSFNFLVTVAKTGYVVVLQLEKGKIKRIFPQGDEPVLFHPSKEPQMLKESEDASPLESVSDSLGVSSVKAVLVNDKATAKALMGGVDTGGVAPDDTKEVLNRTAAVTMLTASAQLDNAPLVLGGISIVDLSGAWSVLKSSKGLQEQLRLPASFELGRKLKAEPTANDMTFYLNLLLTDLSSKSGTNDKNIQSVLSAFGNCLKRKR